ncbi:MAG: DinB family protein [Salibacteraceae bacterium]
MIESLKSLTRDPYFDLYLSRVEFDDAFTELQSSLAETIDLLSSLNNQQLQQRYAPNKWSIGEVVIHCIETELIFLVRALTIARSNKREVLPGFDQDVYANSLESNDLEVGDMIEYVKSTRSAFLLLARTLSEDQLDKIGNASNKDVQVRALFFISSGHFRHHMHIIRERYL